ncbi:MAG: hypothetical protein GY847_19190 [Proteobacteria bacterium]|nr:hypothetical protein [Pseudomonadota bacterium]
MKQAMTIKQRPLECEKKCAWHKAQRDGKTFEFDEIFPSNCCPILYHSLYPYFLGLLYGAKFNYNDHGDCNVSCPAANGVDAVVKKRKNDGSFDSRISKKMEFVIHAEITGINTECPQGHCIGDIVVFPTCMMDHYLCPAGFNNVFPFMDYELPGCIDRDNLRCPDGDDVIHYAVK